MAETLAFLFEGGVGSEQHGSFKGDIISLCMLSLLKKIQGLGLPLEKIFEVMPFRILENTLLQKGCKLF